MLADGISALRVTPDGLLAPVSFIHATPADLEANCNGCGTEDIDVPDSFGGVCITDAGDIHDWMYSAAKSRADKLIADLVFLVNNVLTFLAADIHAESWCERRRIWPALRFCCVYFIGVWRWGVCENANVVPVWAKALNKLRHWGLPW